MTNERPEIIFTGAREARTFPSWWQHPKDGDGRYIPLFPTDYAWDGDGIACMPAPASETAIAAYETTSEGTPISPTFPNTPEGKLALCAWCADNATTFGNHTTSGEGWAALLFGDAGVALDGTVRA